MVRGSRAEAGRAYRAMRANFVKMNEALTAFHESGRQVSSMEEHQHLQRLQQQARQLHTLLQTPFTDPTLQAAAAPAGDTEDVPATELGESRMGAYAQWGGDFVPLVGECYEAVLCAGPCSAHSPKERYTWQLCPFRYATQVRMGGLQSAGYATRRRHATLHSTQGPLCSHTS